MVAHKTTKDLVLVSGASKSFKVWKLGEDISKKKQIEILEMCKKVQINGDIFSSDESESENDVNENNEPDEIISFTKKY